MTTPATVGRPELKIPGHSKGLLDVFHDRFLLRLIVRKELRVRYRGSILGMVWSYVKPLTQFLVFFFAMGVFLKLRETIPDYVVYLFAGIVTINYFSEAFGNATRCLVWNAPLINKIFLPRELFPVASLWVAIIHFLPQFIVLLLAALISGWRPSFTELLAGVLGFAIVSILALGLGLIFGAINVFYRDAENFVDLILMVATWCSPVLYSWQMVFTSTPRWLWYIYQANPLTAAVELFHHAFWYGALNEAEVATALAAYDGLPIQPNHLWTVGLIALLVSCGILAIGQLVFRRLEGRFAQEL
ncbi:MAG: ABC transporter permease [Propionibacteriaceae bacterium]|nr:ABC transporter permease [Propionibacteriaceae bacterium]